MTVRIDIALETTPRRTFASAVDWPGLARSGKGESAAIEAVLAYVDRYASVAAEAGETFPTDDVLVEVIEAAEGDATTEFGAPGRVTESDRRPTGPAEADRLARIVAAAWDRLDRTAASAPEALRKGPRGGGRDTSKVVEHALMADHAYARQMGIRIAPPTVGDAASVKALRAAMLATLREPSDGSALAGRTWPPRYAAHRIAWHALDHAWEIEDRAESGDVS